MEVLYNLVADFIRPSKSNTIVVSENDNGTRVLHITLLNDKVPMDMTEVVSVILEGVTSSGAKIYDECEILTDEDGNQINEVRYTLNDEITKTAGKITLTVSLRDFSGNQITSFEMYVSVRNALYSEDDYIEEKEIQGFRDLLTKCQAALKKMESMVEKEALPNPQALNVAMEDVTYNYNGADQVDIDLTNLTRFADDPVIDVEDMDESAAKIASEAAKSAEEDRIMVINAKLEIERDTAGIDKDVADAKASAITAIQAVAQCAAAARDAEKAIEHVDDAKEYIDEAMGKLPPDVSGLLEDISELKSGKQDKLTAGANISIENNVISSSVSAINNLESTSTTDALSAYMGKVLNESMLKKMGNIEHIDTLTAQGIYTITPGTAGNKPPIGYPYATLVMWNTYSQIVFAQSMDAMPMFIRWRPSDTPGAWRAWHKISTTEDLEAFDDKLKYKSPIIKAGHGILAEEDNSLETLEYVGYEPSLTFSVDESQLTTKQDKLTAGANIKIEGNVISATGGGTGGTSNYPDLTNLPQINSVTLIGNKSLADLGIASASDLSDLADLVGTANAMLEGV